MKEVSKLLRKVIKLQKEENLIPPNSSLLVALSGGIDSVVLTHVLIDLKDFFKLKKLSLAHFNHKIRPEADREEKFCRELAEDLGLEIFVGSQDVEEVARRERENLEETARRLRYSFLRKVKDEEGFDLIATAHHLNDLVETAIIWLTRGAGLEGLIGFEPKEGDVVRPLYRATREEIKSFATSKGLRWMEDTSNRDPRFFRNRVRHEVVPVLKEVNPNLEESFLRSREILKAENEFLESVARRKMEELLEEGCLRADKLLREHVAIQRRILKNFTGERNFSKIEQARSLLKRGGEIDLGKGVILKRKGRLMCLKRNR
jgi:tRNA(Ile)-lysidine synthase